MRLKHAFETMKLDDQIVAIPVGEGATEYHGVIKLNETAAFIFELLKQESTEESIIDALEKEYDVSRDIVTKDVQNYITMFREKGFLV